MSMMSPWRSAIALGLLGCVTLPGSLEPSGTASVRDIDWTNRTYDLARLSFGFDARVLVQDGEWIGFEALPEGERSPAAFFVDLVAYGDVTRDGQEEAVVVTSLHRGGASLFSELTVFALGRDGPRPIGSIAAGVRGHGSVQIAEVEDGSIRVLRSEMQPQDPECCPSGERWERWDWDGEGLARLE